MLNRIIGGILLIAAIGLGIYAGKDYFQKPTDIWTMSSPAKRISLMVEDDFKTLALENELPPEWKLVSKVSYKFESSLTKVLMDEDRPNLRTSKPKSNSSPEKKTSSQTEKKAAAEKPKEYELEIDVLDVPDEENPGFIFQMSLLESGSKNKIFELGRTYHWSTLNLKNLDEKKPD